MRPDGRAILFDLDDTLYPLREFIRSGFAAAARHLENSRRIGRGEAFRFLSRASVGAAHGRELRACATHFGLPQTIVPELVQVIRDHVPSIALPLRSRAVLEAMRLEWRIGIVTDGAPDIQARKVAALGIESLIDCVVYANAVGDRRGQPKRNPFLAAASGLRVAVERTVFVGGDAGCDAFGAGRLGMRTIHVSRRCGTAIAPVHRADATVETLAEVPAVAARLVDCLDWSAHVA
jgi:putative hydrolase of the HAD superfamily